MSSPFYPNVHVKLSGEDGNAFHLLGICQKAAKRADVSKEEISKFMEQAMDGDYDHLLQTCAMWFDVD